MKELSPDEMKTVLSWLDEFGLVKSPKIIHRELSDGVVVASLLKKLYPQFVEIHNYPNRNSYHLKMDNWNTLNRKVFRRLEIPQSPAMITNLCNAVPGAGEVVCHEIMTKFAMDQKLKYLARCNGDDSLAESTSDIISVKVDRKSKDGVMEKVLRKMVNYPLYEQSQATVYEQQQSIAILNQKIEHLENLLKLKCQRIEDLLAQLARRPSRIEAAFDQEQIAADTN